MRLKGMNPEEAARIIRGIYAESIPKKAVAMATKEFDEWKSLQYDQRWEYGVALLSVLKYSAKTFREEAVKFFNKEFQDKDSRRCSAIREMLGKSYQWNFDGERYMHIIGWLPGFTTHGDEFKVILDHRGSTHKYWSGCYVETFSVSSVLKHIKDKSLEPFDGTIKIVC